MAIKYKSFAKHSVILLLEQVRLKEKQILLSRFLLEMPFLQLSWDYIMGALLIVSQMISAAALL